MNTKINQNDSAFPITENIGLTGLTIRQEFAARAMQGILSSIQIETSYTLSDVAKYSVAAADALIAELNKDIQS